jgi:hypothetical protein
MCVINKGVYLTNPKNVRVLGRLKRDLRAAFGARIPIDTLGSVLGFSSAETLQQALKRTLRLNIHFDQQRGQPYVNTDELLSLLNAKYEEAARHEDNPIFEEVKMEK